MWNENKSLCLSKACVWAFLALVLAVCAGTPWFLNTQWQGFTYGDIAKEAAFCPILWIEYAAAVPACLALWKLRHLLANIGKEQVFVGENVKILRALSWHCIVAGAVFFAGAVCFWLPLILLATVCAFAGLILRVVKNVFAEAVRLKNENDFTI